MNIEQVLAMPLYEKFIAGGKAPNIVSAHNMSWDALTTACGGQGEYDTGDPVGAWALKGITHSYDPATGGVEFQAEFVRDPNYEVVEA